MIPANMLKFYINGQWVDPISKARMGVENPATEEIVARWPWASRGCRPRHCRRPRRV
jgi:hypothetical protein